MSAPTESKPNRQGSIRARFLWAILILLPVALGIMALALDNAYRQSALQDEKEKLELNILNTLGQLEVSQSAESEGLSLAMPDYLMDANFNRPSSGFYAFAFTPSGKQLWQSQSSETENWVTLPEVTSKAADPGIYQFIPDERRQVFLMQHVSLWEVGETEHPVHLIIAKSKHWYESKLQTYRQTLWWSLFIITIVLTSLLYSIIRWGLSPIINLSEQVKELEAGERNEIEGIQPKELTPLVNNLKELIKSERDQRERYRNTLGDLAHSLKTPLAVMNGLSVSDSEVRRQLDDQVDNMNRIVEYQLQRAVAASKNQMMPPIPAKPIIDRIINVLAKVYAEKNIEYKIDVSELFTIRGDERDLMELIGNILENAFKYTQSEVKISHLPMKEGKWVTLVIEDNGSGIPQDKRALILKRGQRADTLETGQGIGLAVAMDIIESYGGTLKINDSAMGGASFLITLPG